MAAAAASPRVPAGPEASSSLPGGLLPRPAVAISWDSSALHHHAERSEIESKECVIDPALLPTLEASLQEIAIFKCVVFFLTNDISLVFPISGQGYCYGVLPILAARVPVLKVVDQGTGVECDISIENKDGLSRSMIFKFISSIDERFRILCYLMKFWAKAHDVNSPKDQTMSSMAIISLVAFHLQTRHPPILPAFSVILKDGSDFASIKKNVSLLNGFGSINKESIAELFVSLMIKLVSVEGLWEEGLCASNFEGSWISKTWARGVGCLSVEDFLDRSQNFARAVGMEQMQRICECLRATVSDLSKFFKGKIAAPKLKALLFGPLNQAKPLNQVKPVTNPSQKIGKRKRVSPNKTSTDPSQRNAKKKKPLGEDKAVISDDKEKVLEQDKAKISPSQKDDNREKPLEPDKVAISPGQKDDKKKPLDQDKTAISSVQKDAKKKPLYQDKPAIPSVQKGGKKKPLYQDKLAISPVQKDTKKKSSNAGCDSGSSHVQQKKAKVTVYTSSSRAPPSVSIPPQRMHWPVPTQPIINQFAHIPQHLVTPPAFGYGLPPQHLHSAYHHPHQGLLGQPQGDFLHLHPGIQLQHPGQAMFGPPVAHHPGLNGLHPYGINGAQQMQHINNKLVQRPPYGMGPGFWR
nr:unnamed protein product [Digitaria exilis]